MKWIGATVLALLLSGPASGAILDQWTTRQVSTNHFGLTHMLHAQGRYVAAGWHSDWGAILTSENGFDWVLRSDGNSTPAFALSFVTGLNYVGSRFFLPWVDLALPHDPPTELTGPCSPSARAERS